MLQSQKCFSFRGAFAPWPGALPLDPAGGFAPRPPYRLALHALTIISILLILLLVMPLVTPFFDTEYLGNGTTYRHSLNEIPLGTYSRPTQLYHFEFDLEWLSKIFNDTKRRAVSLLQLSLLLSVGVTWVNNTGFCSVARLARVTFLCFSKLLHSVIVIIPQSVSSKFHF